MLNDNLVSTGNYPFPIQINQGVVFERDAMTITHDEADTLLMLVPLSKIGDSTLYVAEAHVQLRRFALAFIHSHSGATGVF